MPYERMYVYILWMFVRVYKAGVKESRRWQQKSAYKISVFRNRM
jgi:hypothetical protein